MSILVDVLMMWATKSQHSCGISTTIEHFYIGLYHSPALSAHVVKTLSQFDPAETWHDRIKRGFIHRYKPRRLVRRGALRAELGDVVTRISYSMKDSRGDCVWDGDGIKSSLRHLRSTVTLTCHYRLSRDNESHSGLMVLSST